MTVLQIIRAIAPEFDSVSDDKVNQLIEIFKPMVSKSAFGDKYELALAYYIAHKMDMGGMGASGSGSSSSSIATMGRGFGISSISAGGESISFAGTNLSNLTTDAEFSTTIYGTQFLQIRKMCIIPIRSAGES